MSWVTIVWSMIASAALTLGVIYCMVWYRSRASWAPLLFSLSAVSTAVFAFFELSLMRAETPAEVMWAMKWSQVPIYIWLLSILWFVRIYLGAGRMWLAWTVTGVRTIYLLIGLLLVPNVIFREVEVRHIQFLGESVAVAHGAPSPWQMLGLASAGLMLVFLADTTIISWRGGNRRKGVMVGGSAAFFLLTAILTTSPVVWGGAPAPIVLSVPYMAMIAVMGYELSRDVLRASELVVDLRRSNQQISDLFGRLIATQESERTRIARDLHDDVSQRVAALSLMMSGLKRRLSGQPNEADLQSALTSMQQATTALAEEIRHVSHDLHPSQLQLGGLVRALLAFCSDFEKFHAIKISFTAVGAIGDVERDTSLCLYRVTQEALRNVAKHAEARQVRVELSRGPHGIQLSISDDGKGFDEVKMREERHGLGLISIDERVRLLRGTVQIKTRRQGGTRLNVHLPLSIHSDDLPASTLLAIRDEVVPEL
jgi:signal transduction histidine kinase